MLIFRKINEYIDHKEMESYNNMIDYTKISDSLTNDQIKEICQEADDNNYYSICVLPQYVATARSFVKNTKITSLIDFPNGNSGIKTKIAEIDNSIINGANDVDVVINYKLIKSIDDHDTLKNDIRELVEFCHKDGINIKIVIEIGALNYQDIENICKMCIDGNVDYIMTSTGKLSNDDTFEKKLDKVIFMRKILPDEIKIKFSGGVRSIDQMKDVKKYVDRIATSVIIK